MAACFKCKSGAGYAASREGGKKCYCVDCFENYVELQVRDAFFRQCAVPPDTRVAICVSGGMNSVTLMNILGRLRAQNLARGGAGRVNFEFVVLHLNECGVVLSQEEAGSHFAALELNVVKQAEASGFDSDRVYVSGLVNTLRKNVDVSAADSLLATLNNNRVPLSEREDSYLLLRRTALIAAAREVGCSGLIFGDNAHTCAITALCELVRGRGAHVAANAGYRGLMHDATLFRPLRPLLPKEVLLFARAKGLEFTFTPAPGYNTSNRSLNRALEKFIYTLSIEFRSTVFNVLQSVQKMNPSGVPDGHTIAAPSPSNHGRPPAVPVVSREEAMLEKRCRLCGGVVEAAETYYAGGQVFDAEKSEVCYGCGALIHLLPEAAGSDVTAIAASLADSSVEQLRPMTAAEIKDSVADCLLE